MLCEAGGAVNGAIARSAAIGIIWRRNSLLLACNWGANCTNQALESIFVGFVKCKANTKAKVTMENAELKANF